SGRFSFRGYTRRRGLILRNMSTQDSDDPEYAGRHAAQQAVAAGVPRWSVVGSDLRRDDNEGSIDPSSGLPKLIVHPTSPQLEEWQRRFTAAHNAEIRRALDAGEVNVDFRPFLFAQDVRYEVHEPRRAEQPPRGKPAQTRSVRRIDE